MKLKRLKIDNIASIESAEINFEDLPLSDTSVFLITGDTGSGKSTILDAICLALYGTTPRLVNASAVVSYYGEDNITARNPSNLLRHGSVQASVKLSFLGADGIDYVSVWSVRRKRSGKLENPQMNLSWDKGCVGGREAVERINRYAVGLDFSQFCRTTMLAQGQFMQFLKSKDDEKSQILEKMTGTEIYSDIGRAIETLKKEKESAYNDQKKLTQGIELPTSEEMDLSFRELERFKEEKKLVDKDINHVDSVIKWFVDGKKLEHEFDVYSKRFKSVCERIETDSFVLETRFIDDWDRTENPRKLLHKIKEAEINAERYCLQTDTLKSRFQELVGLKNAFSFEFARKRDEADKLRNEISAEAVYMSIYENIQAIESSLNTASKLSERIEKYSKRCNDIKSMLPLHEKKLDESGIKYEDCRMAVADIENKLVLANDNLKAMDAEGLNNVLVKLSYRKDKLNELILILDNITNIWKTCSELNSEHVRLISDKNNNKEKHSLLSKQYNKEKVLYEEAKRLFDNMELSVRDWALDLRSHLKVGDMCPVCGQKIEKLVSDEECNRRLFPVRENLRNLEERLRRTEALRESSEIVLNGLEQKLLEEKEKIEKAESRYHMLCETANAVFREMSFEVPDIQNVAYSKELVLADISKVSAEIDSVLDRQKKVNAQTLYVSELNSKLAELRNNELSQRTIFEKNQMYIREMKQELVELESNIADNRLLYTKTVEDIGGYINIENWEDLWAENMSGFVVGLKAKASAYFARCEIYRTVLAALDKFDSEFKIICKTEKAILEKWPSWNGLSSADTCFVDGIAELWTEFSVMAFNLADSIAAAEKAISDSRLMLDSFFAEHEDFNLSRIEELALVNDIRDLRIRHESEMSEYKLALNLFEGKKTEITEHEKVCPLLKDESADLDIWEKKKDELKEKQDSCSVEIGRLSQKIEACEQNIAKYKMEKEKEEKLRDEFNSWDELNAEFGGANGMKFRRIAQSFLLNDLLHRANGYLGNLNKRYLLDCEPGTLTVRMLDMYQNDSQGPVDILSGGEGFLVSLSLALALSSLNKKGFSIDTLFIDEGFGTLSGEVLNTVMDMLERLQVINGKRVGIISHVEGLKDRIPVQIRVKRIDLTRSRIEVVDGRM